MRANASAKSPTGPGARRASSNAVGRWRWTGNPAVGGRPAWVDGVRSAEIFVQLPRTPVDRNRILRGWRFQPESGTSGGLEHVPASSSGASFCGCHTGIHTPATGSPLPDLRRHPRSAMATRAESPSDNPKAVGEADDAVGDARDQVGVDIDGAEIGRDRTAGIEHRQVEQQRKVPWCPQYLWRCVRRFDPDRSAFCFPPPVSIGCCGRQSLRHASWPGHAREPFGGK